MLHELDANIGGPIENKIYTIRGTQVMLDFDLAKIYGYDVRSLNQQVKRNISRFPADFMFQISMEEFDRVKSQLLASSGISDLKSQIVISSWGGTRKLPYAFTEQGIYMLATVLRGETANIHHRKNDERIDELFSLMDRYNIEEKQGDWRKP